MLYITKEYLKKLDDRKKKHKQIMLYSNIATVVIVPLSMIFLNKVMPIFSQIITTTVLIADFLITFILLKLNKIIKCTNNLFEPELEDLEAAKGTYLGDATFTTTYKGLIFHEYYFNFENTQYTLYLLHDINPDLVVGYEYTVIFAKNFLIGVEYD